PSHALGIIAGYQGNHHDEFDEFNLQFPWLSIFWDLEIADDTWVRFQPFAGYSWLEEDAFLAQGGGSIALSHRFTDDFFGQLFTRANVNDFRFSIQRDPVLDVIDQNNAAQVAAMVANAELSNFGNDARRRRDRDGIQLEVGLEGTYRFELIENLEGAFRLGGLVDRYEADGDDWTRNGTRAYAELKHDLPFDFRIQLWGSHSYHPYENRSSFAGSALFATWQGADRTDRIWLGRAELFYDVTEWLTLSARYQASDQDSNVRVFDFTREIVGGYVTLHWDDYLRD
ncbi:MAG: hypothetical protein AAF430_26670, partial [Myxococcota bacterium]